MKTHHHYEFSVATYNMLAKSLGTNTIPWVMNVSPLVQRRVVQATAPSNRSFKEWVDETLKPEYMQHFHKNFDSGNYAAMRSFWGHPTSLTSQDDIPKELQHGLTWIDEDTVSYDTKSTTTSSSDDSKNSQTTEKTTTVAKTLRGISKQCLPEDVFHEFFNEVSSKEQNIYSWHQVRGSRIFSTIRNLNPDILSIQEYDCHDVVAKYSEDDKAEISFSQAMSSIGYSGVFLKDPLLNRDPPSGIGVFWLNDTFEAVGANDGTKLSGMITLNCNSQGLNGSIHNVDLQERWHTNTNKNDVPQLMKAADRRNGVLCRLKHKGSGRTVALCTAHLMTTSRDSAKTNKFPGEVRAGELVQLRELVEAHVEPDDALVFVGDFNTDAMVANEIFAGNILSNCVGDGGNPELCRFETGFEVESRSFVWNSHILQDAFEDIHQWGQGVGEGKYCTSRNANRIEWIDYLFYDKDRLHPLFLSDCQTPSNMIPDETHPSDHLPLFSKFRFV